MPFLCWLKLASDPTSLRKPTIQELDLQGYKVSCKLKITEIKATLKELNVSVD